MAVSRYEALVRVVELGSLTKAAAELGCTQSAVSHMINALEAELGFSVLRRSRSGVELTQEGVGIMPSVRDIVNSTERLRQTASSIRGLDYGTVRIGTFTSVAVHWLPSMIKLFQNDYPNVEIKLMNGDYHDVDQWLSEGSADIGFTTVPTSLKGSATALLEDRLLAILPPDHPLASLPRFPVREAEHEPFISLLESSDHDARRALEAAGVKPNIRFTTKDDYAIIAMVEQGLGVSIMPELLLTGRTENVKVMEIVPSASRTIGIVVREGDAAGPATQRFAQYIVEWVKNRYSPKAGRPAGLTSPVCL